ncbi:MAG TPA: hypothetical protein VF258_05505, partial [Luteolibacter sp.]
MHNSKECHQVKNKFRRVVVHSCLAFGSLFSGRKFPHVSGWEAVIVRRGRKAALRWRLTRSTVLLHASRHEPHSFFRHGS